MSARVRAELNQLICEQRERELRDREDGRDLDDWLKAESEVSGNADRR